jgi:hypothetical protein
MNGAGAGVLVAAAAIAAHPLAGCSLALSTEKTEISSPLVHPAPGVERRAVEPFRRIHVEGSIDVEVRVGWPLAVELQGDAGRLVELRTEVRDATLIVDDVVADRPFRHGPRAIVSVPELDAIVAAGRGWVAVTGLDQDRLEVVVRGSGDVRLRGRVARLDAREEGLGRVDRAALAQE